MFARSDIMCQSCCLIFRSCTSVLCWVTHCSRHKCLRFAQILFSPLLPHARGRSGKNLKCSHLNFSVYIIRRKYRHVVIRCFSDYHSNKGPLPQEWRLPSETDRMGGGHQAAKPHSISSCSWRTQLTSPPLVSVGNCYIHPINVEEPFVSLLMGGPS